MSMETQTIAWIVLAGAGVVAVTWFVNWLVSVPHNEIASDFEDIKERNKK